MRLQHTIIQCSIAISIIALVLGGIGGSLQPSRLLLMPILTIALLRLKNLRSSRFCSLQLDLDLFNRLLICIGIISIIWSVDILTTSGYLIVLIINLTPMIMLAVMSGKEIEILQRIIPFCWLIAAFAAFPIAAHELITGEHFFMEFDGRGGGVFNSLPFASVFFGNHNNFSLFLVLCYFGLSFIGIQHSATRKISQRISILTSYIATIFIFLLLLINGSRGGILSFSILFVARNLFPIRKTSILFLTSLILLAIYYISTEEVINNNLFTEYLILKFSDFSNDLEESEGRLSIFEAGLSGIISTLGFGVGAGASSTYLAQSTSVPTPNPHNLLLEWTLNFGAYGSLLLAWFAIKIWKFTKQDDSISKKILIRTFILITPLIGVIQSHITGYTYFWLSFFTLIIQSMPTSYTNYHQISIFKKP